MYFIEPLAFDPKIHGSVYHTQLFGRTEYALKPNVVSRYASAWRGYGYYGGHPGVDYRTLGHALPVLAPAPGVASPALRAYWGRSVRIDHGDGFVSYLNHLSRFNVSAGQRVNRGDVVGFTGASDYLYSSSAGKYILYESGLAPHLDWSVKLNSRWENPLNHLRVPLISFAIPLPTIKDILDMNDEQAKKLIASIDNVARAIDSRTRLEEKRSGKNVLSFKIDGNNTIYRDAWHTSPYRTPEEMQKDGRHWVDTITN